MKSKKRSEIVFHEPPMRWNVALSKYEPDLPGEPTGEPADTKWFWIVLSIFVLCLAILVSAWLATG